MKKIRPLRIKAPFTNFIMTKVKKNMQNECPFDRRLFEYKTFLANHDILQYYASHT